MTDKVEEKRDAEVSDEEIELRKTVRGGVARVDRAIDHRVPR